MAEKYSGDLVRIDPRTEAQHRVALEAPVHGLTVNDAHIWVASGAVSSTSHRGGTLRVAANELPGHYSSIDPARTYDVWTAQAVRVVYDGLLAYHYSSADPQVLVPDLATSVPEPTDGGRTYTFTLRPGIRYSTGAEVKASDFVRGVHRALVVGARPDFYAGIVGARACIDNHASCDLSKGVIADDTERRVTFHLAAPDPQFLYKLTILVVPTPPGTPPGRIASPLPGTGPYRIASYTPDKAFTLARNRYFNQWSAPAQPSGFLDAVTWVKVPDARAATDAVQQGRADLAELRGLDTVSLGRLIDGLRVTAPTLLHRSIRQGTGYVVLNSSLPPFDNLLARRAFNYALDRTKAVKLLGGPSNALPTCQLMPPSMPSYQPYCPYTVGRPDGGYHGPDLAKARALVRASGSRGMQVTVTDVIGDFNGPLEPYLTRVLRSLGYRTTLRRLPDTPRNERFFYDPRSGIQVESNGWYADFPLPSNFYELVACDTRNVASAVASPVNYCNRGLDRRAAAANRMLQTEPGAALRAWTEIDRALTDQAPLVPVSNVVIWWITSERVGNYQNGGDANGPLLSQLWVR